MKFINIKAGFDLLRDYAGGLLKAGHIAVHKDNKIYFGATDKKTVNIMHSESPELTAKSEDDEVVHLAGTETITGDKDFTGALTIDGYSLMKQLESNEIVTVGATGDYSSLQDAFDYAATLSPVGGAKLTIQIQTGTTISGTVSLVGGDYSHVILTSVDAIVTISSTTNFFTLTSCVGPAISVLFDKNSTAGDGFVLTYSTIVVNSSYGLKNAGGANIKLARRSDASVQSGVFTGAGSYGIVANHSSNIDAYGADASGAATQGLRIAFGSYCNFGTGNAQKGGTPSSTDIVVAQGSHINAVSATGGTNITVNTLTSSGVIYQ